jgi:hypothetical protein
MAGSRFWSTWTRGLALVASEAQRPGGAGPHSADHLVLAAAAGGDERVGMALEHGGQPAVQNPEWAQVPRLSRTVSWRPT